MKIFSLFALAALLAWGSPLPSYAYDSDKALDNAGHLCTRQVVRSERRYGIPRHLLAAVAATETGRWHSRLGTFIPWPWTLNVEGKPYFFHSKREAVEAVKAFQAQGKQSIDVGCMQVNLKYHPNAFANISQALEPSFNVDYAARFLRGHYDAERRWKTAVGRYHSHTPQYADRYISNVYQKWYGLAGNAVATTATSGKQLPPRRYTSFVSVGESKKVFSPKRDRKAASQNRVTNAGAGTRHGKLALIQPVRAAGEIETAPTTATREATNGPLVLNVRDKNSKPASAKVVAVDGVSSGLQDEESRFIHFTD